MELGLRLAQKQTLKLVMTPRLQQALKLLQMPSLELSQHIEQELLTNPLLELEEDVPEPTTSDTEPVAEEATPTDERELKSEEDINWSDYFDDGFEYADGARAEREDTEFFERTPVGRTTLIDSLTEQLHLLDLDEESLRIAEYLLGCLDDSGFVVIPLDEVAEELGVAVEATEAALRRIQELDPPGVGARDLPESLMIQLRLHGEGDSLAGRIVEGHFEAFKQRQYQEIARSLKVTPADVQDAAREIATLNPRPGAQLALEDARYVVPDLVIENVDGQYVVSLSDGSVPRLRVSRQYQKILERGAPSSSANSEGSAPSVSETTPSANGSSASAVSEVESPESKDEPRAAVSGEAVEESTVAPSASPREQEFRFVQEKLKSANWLIQTIEQRRRTMIKVMEAIVEAQYDFFDKGPQALRPLTLQDVAEKIGMHESTVSRVTTNKYVQTPRGVLPLKYFFSSGLDTESGSTVSSKMAMDRIKQLIEKENRKKPLSDQRIAELLRKEGLIVARRTVAKYRERLGILSARYRKEF
jgi:RNA polymerase sigma-54 factor